MPSEPQVSSVPARAGSRWALGRLWPLLLIAALGVLVIAMGWHRELSLESLVRRRADLESFIAAHFFTALLAYVGLYIVVVAMSVPGALFLTITGGVLFGWLAGGTAAVFGATIGASLIFLIARHALSDYVQRKAGPRLASLAAGFKADALNYLLFLRLAPVFPFWLVNLAPAVLGVGLGTFIAATALGIIPATFAYASVGAGLDSVIGAQETAYKACLAAGRSDCRLDFDLKAAVTPQLLIALSALGILSLVPVIIRRWRGAPARARSSG